MITRPQLALGIGGQLLRPSPQATHTLSFFFSLLTVQLVPTSGEVNTWEFAGRGLFEEMAYLGAMLLLTSVPAVPRLDGIFLSLNSINAAYSATQWALEFEAMARVGINFVCVRAALVGRSNSTAGGCTLGTYTAYYPTTLAPTKCYTHAALADGSSALGNVLDGAATHGVQVHITPAMPHSPFAWPGGADYFAQLTDLQVAAFADVWAAYPQHHETIVGVYSSLEQWNGLGWMKDSVAGPMATDYFEPLARRVRGLSDSTALQVWASPYYVGNRTLHSSAQNASSYAAYWARVWAAAPSFDWIALQDSRGWQGNSDAEVAVALAALQAAAAAAGPTQALWSNVELFEGWPAPCEYPTKCGRHPAPIARIVMQLASENPFVGGRHIAWEWSSCLSPQTNVNTSRLYADYAQYVGANVSGIV